MSSHVLYPRSKPRNSPTKNHTKNHTKNFNVHQSRHFAFTKLMMPFPINLKGGKKWGGKGERVENDCSSPLATDEGVVSGAVTLIAKEEKKNTRNQTRMRVRKSIHPPKKEKYKNPSLDNSWQFGPLGFSRKAEILELRHRAVVLLGRRSTHE